jgi:hypothetical protein
MSEENDVEEKTIVFIPPPWPESPAREDDPRYLGVNFYYFVLVGVSLSDPLEGKGGAGDTIP